MNGPIMDPEPSYSRQVAETCVDLGAMIEQALDDVEAETSRVEEES